MENTSKIPTKFKVIVAIICFLLFVSGIALGYFAGIKMAPKRDKEIITLGKKNTTKKADSEWESPYKYLNIDVDKLVSEPAQKDDITNKIQVIKVFKIKDSLSEDRSSITILAKNNNSVPVDVDFALNYYDADGYNINHTSDTLNMVGAGKEFVLTITPMVKKSEDVKTYKLVYKATKEKSYNHYLNISENDFVITETEREFSISYTNKTGKDIDYSVNGALIFYQGNNIVFADKVYMSSGAGNSKIKNGTSVIGTVYKNKFEGIKYDKYKIISSSAYYRDENW